MVYLHDGTFDGFLTCVYRHYYEDKADGIYEDKSYRPMLLQEVSYVETESMKADRVHSAIMSKFTEEMYFTIYHTFLSNEYEKDTWLLRYIQLAFKHGKDIAYARSLDDIYRVQKIGRQVGFEKHRFLGLLRFSDLGTCLYARFEPDHNIVTLLADHFCDRFKNEKFIIHDQKRQIAVIGYEGRWLLIDYDHVVEETKLKEEVFFRALWKEYFNHIGIEGRKNERLQQSFVPLKYRKHLIEFEKSTQLRP